MVAKKKETAIRRRRGKSEDTNIVRALLVVDAINAFASQEYGGELCVPEGELVGPVIGHLQEVGRELGIYDLQVAVNDRHPKDMFNFAHMHPHKVPFVDRVQDRDGEWATVYPAHAIVDTWGAEFLPGVKVDLFDRVFAKGTARDKDSYSAFGNPQLLSWLRKKGVTHIDVVGLVHRICKGLTAIEAAQHGFRVRDITDATKDLPIDSFQWVLNEMKYLGIESVTSHQVIG